MLLQELLITAERFGAVVSRAAALVRHAKFFALPKTDAIRDCWATGKVALLLVGW